MRARQGARKVLVNKIAYKDKRIITVNSVPRDPIYYHTPLYIKTNFFNLRAPTSLYIKVLTHSMTNSTPR